MVKARNYSEDQILILRQAAAILSLSLDNPPQRLAVSNTATARPVSPSQPIEQLASPRHEGNNSICDLGSARWASHAFSGSFPESNQTSSHLPDPNVQNNNMNVIDWPQLGDWTPSDELLLPTAQESSIFNEYPGAEHPIAPYQSIPDGSRVSYTLPKRNSSKPSTAFGLETIGDALGPEVSAGSREDVSHQLLSQPWQQTDIVPGVRHHELLSENLSSTARDAAGAPESLAWRVPVYPADNMINGQRSSFQNPPQNISSTTSENYHGSSTPSSSTVVMTPASHSDSKVSSNGLSLTPEDATNIVRAAALHGPCSYVWNVPPRVRGP